jgi:hypothetical protein
MVRVTEESSVWRTRSRLSRSVQPSVLLRESSQRRHGIPVRDGLNSSSATMPLLRTKLPRSILLEDSQRVSGDTINSAQENPQFSVILQREILGASQTENPKKHRLLAQLVAERLAAPPESRFALAVKLACDALAVLNSAQLRLLALSVALHEIRPSAPMPPDDYRQWLDRLLAPVLSSYLHDHAEYKEIDVLHLSALGCVTYDRASERALELVLSMKNGLFKVGFAFDYPSFKESDLGWYFDYIWVEGFAGVNLTSIGSVIGGLVFDELSGVRVGHPHWARDDRGVTE